MVTHSFKETRQQEQCVCVGGVGGCMAGRVAGGGGGGAGGGGGGGGGRGGGGQNLKKGEKQYRESS